MKKINVLINRGKTEQDIVKRHLEISEREKITRRPCPKEIETICKEYENFMHRNHKDRSIPYDLVKNLNVSQKEVYMFLDHLRVYQKMKDFKTYSACYLTALLQSSENDHFVLKFGKYPVLDNVCTRIKTKTVTVNGNVGESFGYSLRGGKLILNGDAGMFLGHHMKRGIIELRGNANSFLGEYQRGGEIHCFGKEEPDVGNVREGKVYHNEKLICSDGDTNFPYI